MTGNSNPKSRNIRMSRLRLSPSHRNDHTHIEDALSTISPIGSISTSQAIPGMKPASILASYSPTSKPETKIKRPITYGDILRSVSKASISEIQPSSDDFSSRLKKLAPGDMVRGKVKSGLIKWLRITQEIEIGSAFLATERLEPHLRNLPMNAEVVYAADIDTILRQKGYYNTIRRKPV